MSASKEIAPQGRLIRADNIMLWALGAVNAGLHLAFANGYGIFRDELYYIACSNHLDWGYLDHPPLSIFVLWIERALLGDSLLAIRAFSSIATGVTIALVGFIAREMGGGRFAQVFASLCAMVMPVQLGLTCFYSMNAFDAMFWAIAIWVLCRLVNTGNPRWWLWFGLVAGVGLENKLTILALGFAVALGLLLTPHRTQLLSPYLYAGAAIALAIFIPHLIWQIRHHWPTIEFLHNSSLSKNTPTNPLKYFLDQILSGHPFVLPIWVMGVGACLFHRPLRPYRILGIMFVTLFLLYSLTNGKAYYIFTAYPLAVGAGAVMFERLTSGRRGTSLRRVYIGCLILGGCLSAPFALPILPVKTLLAYQRALGVHGPRQELSQTAQLEQPFADEFGWKELVDGVARVYYELPEAEKSKCSIIGTNYGQAAAVDWFGARYGLPKAISTHNNYWIWGPGNATGEVVISIGNDYKTLKPFFEEGAEVETVTHALSEEQSIPIWVFRRLKPDVSIQEIWNKEKHLI